jgi:hypothetical protein
VKTITLEVEITGMKDEGLELFEPDYSVKILWPKGPWDNMDLKQKDLLLIEMSDICRSYLTKYGNADITFYNTNKEDL